MHNWVSSCDLRAVYRYGRNAWIYGEKPPSRAIWNNSVKKLYGDDGQMELARC